MTFLSLEEHCARVPSWIRELGAETGNDFQLESPALLVLDMQSDFLQDQCRLPVWGGRAIVPNIAGLTRVFRELGRPVVYTRHICLAPTGKALTLGITSRIRDAPNLLQDGNPAANIVDDLAPCDTDHVIVKHQYSALYETGLDSLLETLAVGTVVVTGVMTNICCQATATDLFSRGYEVIVPLDGTGGLDENSHIAALKTIQLACGRVTTTDHVLTCLTKRR